jgi:hypothetical protein
VVIGLQAAWHPDLSPVALAALAAALAGLATTCFVSPADVVKVGDAKSSLGDAKSSLGDAKRLAG